MFNKIFKKLFKNIKKGEFQWLKLTNTKVK